MTVAVVDALTAAVVVWTAGLFVLIGVALERIVRDVDLWRARRRHPAAGRHARRARVLR